jgi:hypothetical protein
VERTINVLKNFRAVATRFDKRAYVFHGTVTLSSIRLWLRPWSAGRALGLPARGAFTSRCGGTYGLWDTQSSSAGQRCAQSGGSVSL